MHRLLGWIALLILLLACNVSFPDSDEPLPTLALLTEAADGLDEAVPAGQPPTNQPELAAANTLISHNVAPDDTDSLIDKQLQPHLAYLNPAASSRQQLLLFLPGTNARPDLYSQFLQTGANLGYHVIGLSYVNDDAVGSFCRISPDMQCHEKVRTELITGADTTPFVNINEANSIENRLFKLLQYLADEFPDEDWSQYLQDSEPVWANIAVAGHSQGGGHAGLLARWYQVARVIFFNSPADYNANAQLIASWIDAENATPADRYYAFFHNQDGGERRLAIYEQFGMGMFGEAVNSDVIEPPYNDSHMIFTDSPTQNAHSVIIGDPLLTLDENDVPLVQPVWIYILTGSHAE